MMNSLVHPTKGLTVKGLTGGAYVICGGLAVITMSVQPWESGNRD